MRTDAIMSPNSTKTLQSMVKHLRQSYFFNMNLKDKAYCQSLGSGDIILFTFVETFGSFVWKSGKMDYLLFLKYDNS